MKKILFSLFCLSIIVLAPGCGCGSCGSSCSSADVDEVVVVKKTKRTKNAPLAGNVENSGNVMDEDFDEEMMDDKSY